MITLITGALGTGKTALAVKLVSESEFYPSSAFVFGVRGWKGAGHYEELPLDPPRNQERVEAVGRIGSSVFFIDEAKKIWPSRVAGRPVPEFIDSHLAESRSVGQDWILTAQSPGQLDIAVRRLVGRHIHLEKVALGVKKCEAGACRDDLKFSDAESEKFVFPVASLKLYDSADLETSHQKKGIALPKKLIWLGLAVVCLFGVSAWFALHSRIVNSVAGSSVSAVIPDALSKSSGGGLLSSGSSSPAPSLKQPELVFLAAAPSAQYLNPRQPDYPEIAKSPRLPVSCVSGHGVCKCYDQATQLIPDIGRSRCLDIVAGRNALAVLYPVPQAVASALPESQTRLSSRDSQSSPPGLGRGFDDGAKPDVPRSPAGVSPSSGDRVSGVPRA